MLEPLEYYYGKVGFKKDLIAEIVCGKRYMAVMLKTGEIGVCATFGEKYEFTDWDFENFSLKNFKHRVLLNAYYNACFNYKNDNYENADLVDFIDFDNYKNIVMIGYFKPIVEKFCQRGIKTHIFDLRDTKVSLPMSEQKEYLQKCDLAIVTATTVFNKTFSGVCNNSNGDVFILGPSAFLNDYLFEFNNVKGIMGSVFNKFDSGVLDIIRQDLGTRHFLKLGKKVVYKK